MIRPMTGNYIIVTCLYIRLTSFLVIRPPCWYVIPYYVRIIRIDRQHIADCYAFASHQYSLIMSLDQMDCCTTVVATEHLSRQQVDVVYFITQRFGERSGMLLCRPYVLNLNSPLATRSRHLRAEEQYKQRFVKKIGKFFSRSYVVHLNRPWPYSTTCDEISPSRYRAQPVYPPGRKTTKHSSHTW